MDETGLARKASLTGLLKAGVEECGKHPFATGLFSILGVVGLVFSFYDSGVSQAQADESSKQAEAIRSELSQVNETLAKSPEKTENEADFVPFRAWLEPDGNLIDNVTFPERHLSNASLQFTSENINDTIAEVRTADPAAFSEFWTLAFNVTSLTNLNYVQIAPYLVIDVRDVRSLNDRYASIYAGERGAGDVVREFNAYVLPQTGFQYAPVTGSGFRDEGTKIDFFTLSPREPEEFILNLTTVPGYVYDLRIGIHYKYQDSHRIHWVTPYFRSGMPAGELQVWSWNGEFSNRIYPDTDYWTEATISQFAAEAQDKVVSGKVFRPSQIPAQYQP